MRAEFRPVFKRLEIKNSHQYSNSSGKSNSHVVQELGGDHDAGDEQAVDVEGVERERRLPLREPLEVDVGDHEAGGAAVGVLEDPLQVAPDRDGGPRQAVEDRDPLGLLVDLAVQVVGLRRLLQQRGEEGDEPGHRVRALEIRHREQFVVVLLLLLLFRAVPCRVSAAAAAGSSSASDASRRRCS